MRMMFGKLAAVAAAAAAAATTTAAATATAAAAVATWPLLAPHPPSPIAKRGVPFAA